MFKALQRRAARARRLVPLPAAKSPARQAGVSFALAAQHAPGVRLLCANVLREDEDVSALPGSAVIEARCPCGRSVRVGVVALIGADAFQVIQNDLRRGLRWREPIEAARRECEQLSQCEVLVCLSHSGARNGGDRALAEAGIFDVIFSGHEVRSRK